MHHVFAKPNGWICLNAARESKHVEMSARRARRILEAQAPFRPPLGRSSLDGEISDALHLLPLCAMREAVRRWTQRNLHYSECFVVDYPILLLPVQAFAAAVGPEQLGI